MFQRLKGAIDSRIAEEQARQKTVGSSISRSPSTSRTPTSSTESPRQRKPKSQSKDYDSTSKGPDPSDFENAFVIEDDSEEPSRVGTPSIKDEKMPEAVSSADGKMAEKAADSASRASATELPANVQMKLKKLETLELKYKELLKSYRVAHGRAVSIEPFEKVLRETTTVDSIKETDAFKEYMNQQKSSKDMIMDEFRRVTSERDDFKKKLEESEKQREELVSQQSSTGNGSATTTEKGDTSSINTPSGSVKSPMSSVLGLGIFSPKQKAQATSESKDGSEEFFSYDEEIPNLQAEVREKTAEVEGLKTKVSTLESDLALAQEKSSTLVEKLQKTTKELDQSKEAAAAGNSLQKKMTSQTEELTTLKAKLEATEAIITTLESELTQATKADNDKMMALESEHSIQAKSLIAAVESKSQKLKDSETAIEKLSTQILGLEKSKVSDAKRIEELLGEVESLHRQAEKTPEAKVEESAQSKPAASLEVPATTGTAKKKNKKKKKGANAAIAAPAQASIEPEKSTDSDPPTPGMTDLEAEISRLKSEILEKDAQIEKFQKQRKTEADLRDEIENMQENLINIGQEHVEAKDKIKELTAEKTNLQEKIANLESEIETHKRASTISERADAELKTLTAQYEDLKLKSATLQTDLGAAQQLATSRYRDLTKLQDVLHQAQPELKSLRSENATLKSTKEELATRTSELRRLEAREKDFKADIAIFKKQAADRDGEVRALNEKITQETNAKLTLENQNRIAQRDLRKTEAEKIQLAAAGEKSMQELTKVQEEAGKLRVKVIDLEEEVTKLTDQVKGLREEVELRGSQYNNSESLVSSMRDQQSEMAMQLKEFREKSESLDDELGDVRRLLDERTRDGEKMRRLLADADERADSKVREMRERMESAIEERDRAEDEAATSGRRRAREVDELKTKIRDFERDLKRAIDDRDELQQLEKEWKRKRDELETEAETAKKESEGYRSANDELRGATDRSEKQLSDERKKNENLRRTIEDLTQRCEKLNKELKASQAKPLKMNDVSTRSSLETGRSGSPIPANGAAGKMDYVYLKTILLQFLEQKDKKRQADLVKTVLGQLLHFDKKDQEKWIAAISTK